MTIQVDAINTVDDLLEAVQASFAADSQGAAAEVKELLEQDRVKPLWQAIWNDRENLNYAQQILKLPCSPKVMIEIIPTLDQIKQLEPQDLLRNYFLGTQRFDICLSYLMKKSPHDYSLDDLRKFTEPFLSALLTNQLSDESVDYFGEFIYGDRNHYRHLELKYFFDTFGSDSLYESAIYRTIMRNEEFARNMFDMIIDAGSVPPRRQLTTTSEASNMWRALYSHERLRDNGNTAAFDPYQQSAREYYTQYKAYTNPDELDQWLHQGDRPSIKSVLQSAPERLLTVLEAQEELRPVDRENLNAFLNQWLLTEPTLRKAMLSQPYDKPYVVTTNEKAPLTLWQAAWMAGATVLSFGSFKGDRPRVKKIELPKMEDIGSSKYNDIQAELLVDMYVIAQEKNIPLQKEWNALLRGYSDYNERQLSRNKRIFPLHALEDACLQVEKNGAVPANFMELLEQVMTLIGRQSLDNYGRNTAISIAEVIDCTIDMRYLGYLNRWLHQLQTNYPELSVLQEAQELVNGFLMKDGSRYEQRLFGPLSYLDESILNMHPELALWTPSWDVDADVLSRAGILAGFDTAHGMRPESEMYNLLAFTSVGADVAPISVEAVGVQVEEAQVAVMAEQRAAPISAYNLSRLFALRQNELIVKALASSVEEAEAKKAQAKAQAKAKAPAPESTESGEPSSVAPK